MCLSTVDAPIAPEGSTIVLHEDPVIEGYLVRLLARRGYRVVKARVCQALEMVRSGAVSLVITNAPESFASVAERVALLYLSASPNPALVAAFPRSFTLPKPFHPEDFYEAVRELSSAGA